MPLEAQDLRRGAGMKTSTLQQAPVRSNDTPELQAVLHRFVDSRDNYIEGAEIIEDLRLKAVFRLIAEHRRRISATLSELILDHETDRHWSGSSETAVHRWWLKAPAWATGPEKRAVVAECLRGEKELMNALLSVILSPVVESDQLSILQSALDQVIDTVAELESDARKRQATHLTSARRMPLSHSGF